MVLYSYWEHETFEGGGHSEVKGKTCDLGVCVCFGIGIQVLKFRASGCSKLCPDP